MSHKYLVEIHCPSDTHANGHEMSELAAFKPLKLQACKAAMKKPPNLAEAPHWAIISPPQGRPSHSNRTRIERVEAIGWAFLLLRYILEGSLHHSAPGFACSASMIYILPVLMYICQTCALILMLFLAYRYRENVRNVCKSGPKATWSRIFTVFVVSSFLCECLTWTNGIVKCLDTSDTMRKALPEAEIHQLCDRWQRHDEWSLQTLYLVYFSFVYIGVCAFQALVLERYRKVATIFPHWMQKYALPLYTAMYIPVGFAAYLVGVLEFVLSPSTLLSRDATINSISSACYCIFIAFTGLSDASLSLMIVTKIRQGRLDMQRGQSGVRRGSVLSLSTGDCSLPALRRLQALFVAIIVLDCGILSLTAIKKTDGHGLHGHIFAWEVASMEIAGCLVHTFLTLMFMQQLGVILRPTQPQFEFVIDPKNTLQAWQVPCFIDNGTGIAPAASNNSDPKALSPSTKHTTVTTAELLDSFEESVESTSVRRPDTILFTVEGPEGNVVPVKA